MTHLRELLLPAREELHHDWFISRQGGARAHHSSGTQDLREHCTFITKGEWPPIFSNLSPLDYCVEHSDAVYRCRREKLATLEEPHAHQTWCARGIDAVSQVVVVDIIPGETSRAQVHKKGMSRFHHPHAVMQKL